MKLKMRDSGINVIGDISWGTHFCQFYQTKEDLIDFLVPYFKTGLENNEFCIWITTEPVEVMEAKEALGKVLDVNQYLENKQLEILSYNKWYLKNDAFNPQKVLNDWVKKLNKALDRGFDGLRLSGNIFWLEKKDWDNFTDYEEEINRIIGNHRMIAMCTYSLEKCNTTEIIDIVNNHQFTLIKRDEEWTLFESSKQNETKKALEKSIKNEAFLGELLEYSSQPFSVRYPDGQVVLCNYAFEELTGYTKEEIKEIHWSETLTASEYRELEKKKLEQLEKTGLPIRYEKEYTRKDGTRIPVELLVHLAKNEKGNPHYYYSFVTDISKRREEEIFRQIMLKNEQKLSEELKATNEELKIQRKKLLRLNHTLRALSKSEQAMIHAEDEETYLDEVCRIIIEICGHEMVWIGYAQEDENKTVQPVAQYGFDEGYVESLNINWADTERGRGPTGTAIRTGKPCCCRNMLTDPTFKPWVEGAIKRGFASSIVLPLINEDKVLGAMSIYSKEPDSFPDEEIELLDELAHDLAFGINNIRLKKAQEEAESALKKNEERLTIATHAAKAGIWDWDLINGNIDWSPMMFELLGLDPKKDTASFEVWGKTLYFEDREIAQKRIEKALEKHEFLDSEYRILRPDGQIIWINALGKADYDKKGNPLWMTGICIDITERMNAEEEIKRNLKLLNAINKVFEEYLSNKTEENVAGRCLEVAEELTGSDFGFLAKLNEQGHLNYISISPPAWNACKTTSGKTHELVTDMKVVSYWGRTIIEEKSQIVNYPESDPDRRGLPIGHPPINSFLGVPLKQEGKTIGMIALANKKGGYNDKDREDIESLSVAFVEALMRQKAETHKQELLEKEQELREELQSSNEELRKIQDELEKTIDKLEVSNRDLEQFAYVASHDLQEPLRMVSSFTQLLERRYKNQLDENADEYIEFIVDGAKRMKDLINDLLAFSRLNTERREFEPVNMETSLNRVFSYFETSIQETKAKITHDPLPTIMGDPSQITQLFQNLISNAIKFHGKEQLQIHISTHKSGKRWVVGVSDNGIGINQDHQKKIFDIFKRLHTREEYDGTGIGLAICKKIVERHGGKIWVESKPGKGSTFYFTIPQL